MFGLSMWAPWPAPSLIALARSRLARTPGARLGWAGAIATLVLAWAAAVVLYRADPQGDLPHVVRRAVGGGLWLALGPLALSIAHQRNVQDRNDGVDLLAQLRGHSAADLGRARVLAAMGQAALLAALLAVLLSLGVAGSAWHQSARLLIQLPGLTAFSVLAGISVGGLAAWCGSFGGRHGRSWLLALVILPWAVGVALGCPEWSLPGALERALGLLTGSSGRL